MTRHVREDAALAADEAAAAREAREQVRKADETVTIRRRLTPRHAELDPRYDTVKSVEYTVYGTRRVRCEDDSRYDWSDLDKCPECGVLTTYLGNKHLRFGKCHECREYVGDAE